MELLQRGLLRAYRLVFVQVLFRHRFGRRLFFALYDAYKVWFEAGPVSQLQALVPAGALVIDVGANVGFFTRRFARWVGPAGHVIAIEPEPTNFAELMRRIASEGLADRVTARQAVADEKPGEVRLSVNPDHPGDHRIGTDGLPVPAVTIDDIAAADTPRVALVKIDVQGAEMRVLAGAENVLRRDRPALFVEVDPAALARYGGSVERLLGFLARFGYAPHTLDRAGAKPIDRKTLNDQLARRSYVDVLFIAGGKP